MKVLVLDGKCEYTREDLATGTRGKEEGYEVYEGGMRQTF